MNNDINRNTRTLIVSFVLALAVMIPLRFVELGNAVGGQSAAVLGVSTETAAPPRLEAPYDKLDSVSDCLQNEYVDQFVSFLKAEKKKKNVTVANQNKLESEIASYEAMRCQ